ncbi:MAG: hypothetical protein KAQ99_00325 [Candidatus Aureabacteria bacterium]|nr:hypothetical protein [Candidatus Auribacterota bacterium]
MFGNKKISLKFAFSLCIVFMCCFSICGESAAGQGPERKPAEKEKTGIKEETEKKNSLVEIPEGEITATEYRLILTKIKDISESIARDKIVMKNGIEFDGRILEETGEGVKFSSGSGLLKFRNEKIDEIIPMSEKNKKDLEILFQKKTELVKRFEEQQKNRGLVKYKGRWMAREERRNRMAEMIKRKAELKADRIREIKKSQKQLSPRESSEYLANLLDELVWDNPENPPFKNIKDVEVLGNKLLQISKKLSRGYYVCLKAYFHALDFYTKSKNSPTTSTQKKYLKEAYKEWQAAETSRCTVDETVGIR